MSSSDMYDNDVGNNNGVKGHSHERHPLFYFMSFISMYSPLCRHRYDVRIKSTQKVEWVGWKS
jgi:hypothetical protein